MSGSIENIKKLRAQTGAGMNDAKAALEEAGGDYDKAVDVLRQKGIAKAAKKSEREAKAGLVDSYVHMGRVGALVEINCETDFVAKTPDFKNFVHEIAMQVAAANPLYLNPADVPAEVISKEKQLYKAELKGQKKPASVIDKIVTGKLEKYYQEVCLLNQPSIKEPDKSVQELLTAAITKLGENIIISRFERFELGVANAG